jgi:hypothetical protein
MPFIKPVTTSGLPGPVAESSPGDEVTVYDAIAAPPFDAGGLKLTLASPLPGTADTPVGAPGTVRGVTAADGADATPVPAALVAVTVNV